MLYTTVSGTITLNVECVVYLSDGLNDC